MVGLAAAFGCGVTLVLAGASLPSALYFVPALLLPILACLRPSSVPHPRIALALALAAGAMHAQAWERARRTDCRWRLRDGASLQVSGRVVSAPARGRMVLAAKRGLGAACREEVSVLLPSLRGAGATSSSIPPTGLRTGEALQVKGRWRANSGGDDPERAGEIVATSVEKGDVAPDLLLARRAGVESRLESLYPENHGLVSALILARKEGVDPSHRVAFARAGTAHLLAISGFHVGVVAALLLGFLRGVGLRRRHAGAAAALGVWVYVFFIGAPDAAVRAALMLSLLVMGSLRGRPLDGSGALATAFLVLVAVAPGTLARPGFQLSFAGASGLVLLGRPLQRWLWRLHPQKRWRGVSSALAAGIAATLATLPVVAWHFDQVSLVGIPATLLSTPLVALAIPGAFASLAIDLLSHRLALFLAGGVDALLVLLVALTRFLASLPFAVAWVPRSWILAGCAGVLLAGVALSGGRHLGMGVRVSVLAAGAAALIQLLPLVERIAARGTVEILFLDVGQGDAILLRSPGAHWLMVDTGPPSMSDASAAPSGLVQVRRLGIRRLEALLLTHPHLDHIGGAVAVMDALPVGVVVDPGLPSASSGFADVLEAAQREGDGWRAARLGDRLELDGLSLEVLNELDPALGALDDANESSVVVLARFGDFEALLTGDAPSAVEEKAVDLSGPFELLKVGHHGSRTSTSDLLLDRARPEAAVISVGRGNRYGHPHREVLSRFSERGVPVYRTDRDGTVRVMARADGTFTVRVGRGPLSSGR